MKLPAAMKTSSRPILRHRPRLAESRHGRLVDVWRRPRARGFHSAVQVSEHARDDAREVPVLYQFEARDRLCAFWVVVGSTEPCICEGGVPFLDPADPLCDDDVALVRFGDTVVCKRCHYVLMTLPDEAGIGPARHRLGSRYSRPPGAGSRALWAGDHSGSPRSQRDA